MNLNEHYKNSKYRFGLLQTVANRFGDFYIMKSWFVNKEARFAPWQTVLEASEQRSEYKYEVSHRQIYPFEVVLDCDEIEKIPQAHALYDRIVSDNILKEVYMFSTGSRGVHIHIFLVDEYLEYGKNTKLWNKIYKKITKVIGNWGFDTQKCSYKVPIALEFAPHWKSGKQKALIKGRGCFYEWNRLFN